jgi:hypothetical protein
MGFVGKPVPHVADHVSSRPFICVDANVLAELREQRITLEQQVRDYDSCVKSLLDDLKQRILIVFDSYDLEALSQDFYQTPSGANLSLGVQNLLPCFDNLTTDSAPSQTVVNTYSSPEPRICDQALGTGAFFQSALQEIRIVLQKLAKVTEVLSQIHSDLKFVVSRLPRAFVPYGIAICQRRFFTHHGSHPPEKKVLVRRGLFQGRVFHSLTTI